MNFPKELKYTPEHIWVKAEGNTITVGISDFAQDELGDILFVDLPAAGDTFAAGEKFTEIETSKTTSELALPFAVEVVEVNEALDDEPEAINEDAYANWIAKFTVEDIAAVEALLDAAAYEAGLEIEE